MLHFCSSLACAGCLVATPMFRVTALVLGGPLMVYYTMRPFGLSEIRRVWGIPQFCLPDVVSLSLLLVWPAMMARTYGREHSCAWNLAWFSAMACCITFVWFRGIWILQQRQTTWFFKRTVFLAVLLPAALLAGFLVGHGALTLLLVMTFPSIEELFMLLLVYGSVIAILLGLVHCGLRFVFGQTTACAEPSSNERPEDPARPGR